VPSPVAASPSPAEPSASDLIDIAELAPGQPDDLNADLPPLRTTSEHPVAQATAADLATLFAGPELEMP